MASRENVARRVSNLLAAAFVAALSAVVIFRALSLALDADPVSAHNERRWFEWLPHDPELVRQLERAARDLRYGETVCLLGRPVHLRMWLLIMGIYSLPRQIVVVPPDSSHSSSAPPCRRSVLLTRPGRSLLLRRAPDAAFDR